MGEISRSRTLAETQQAPAAVLEILRPTNGAVSPSRPVAAVPAEADIDKRVQAYLTKVGNRPSGERNNTGFQIAAWLRRDMALTEDLAWFYLSLWNTRNTPPLPDRELRACFDNGLEHGRSEIGQAINNTHSWTAGIETIPNSIAGLPGIPTPDNKDAARRIRLTSEAELEATNPPAWRVDDVLPEGGLGLIFGASETFKSFLALFIAWCIALGTDFHGHKVRRGPVIYIAAEGFFGLKKRYLALKRFFGFTGSAGIHFLKHGIDVSKGSADLAGLIDAIRETIDEPPVLIVIDTLNRCLVGNENLPDDMGNYLRGCDQLRESTGAAVISIHHTGHVEADRGRGHSSLRAALDVEIKCSRDGDRVKLECTKLKDGPHFSRMIFDMLPVGDSLVPKPVGTVDVKWTPSRLKAAKALPTEGGLSRPQWAKASELPAGTLRHALDWLVEMAYARVTRDGKYVRTEACRQALVPECQGGAT